MKINAVAPWMGSKRDMAPRIVELLGEHRVYWETYCGGLSVVLAKQPARAETVNDLHGGVVCLARVLADELQGAYLYSRLQKTMFCEALYEDALAFLEEAGNDPPWWLRNRNHGDKPGIRRADANMLEYAYWFFVASWMGRNGTAGTKEPGSSFCMRYTSKGGDPATRFRSAVESMPEWHERLRGLTILCRDAFEIIPQIEDEEGVAHYCDPPYLAKSKDYLHDFRPEDHHRLAEMLSKFRNARIVVSYYDHPMLAELYPANQWRRLECPKGKNMANGVKERRGVKGAVEAPEVLLVNGPIYGSGGGLFDG